MASRYTKYRILNNSSDYYEFLREERNNIRNIRQYETPILHMPTVIERASLKTTKHIWKYGDRFYKLAAQYYDDARYWWVIAQYNATPTEGQMRPGMVITIPLNLEKTLEVLRNY